MKKLFISVVALFAAINSFAQFGVVAGLTSSSSTLQGAYSEIECKSVTQYHIGITTKYAFAGILALQPSLIYNVKGAMLSEFETTSISFKTGYIELPIQIQAGIPFGSFFRAYGFVEPFIGYAVSNAIDGTKIDATWDNLASRLEYGVGMGAGLEVMEHFQFSVRYFWNLGNVYDFSVADILNGPQGKCNGVSASFAFLF